MTTFTITVPDWFVTLAAWALVIWLALFAVQTALKVVKTYYERQVIKTGRAVLSAARQRGDSR